MEENIEISVVIPGTDSRTIQAIVPLLDNKDGIGIPGIQRIVSPKMLAGYINDGKIRTLEISGKAEKTIIGLIITSLIDEPNQYGEFSLVFSQPVSSPETIAIAVDKFRSYYQDKNLSKITVKLIIPATKTMIELLKKCGFIEEAIVYSQFKTKDGYKDSLTLTAVNDGRKMIPLSDSTLSVKTEKAQTVIKELETRIESLKTTLEVREKDLKEKNKAFENLTGEKQELQKQLDAAEKTIEEITQNLSPEVSGLQKEIGESNKQKNKYKQWLEEKNARIQELEAEISQLKKALQEGEAEKEAVPEGKISKVIEEKPMEITAEEFLSLLQGLEDNATRVLKVLAASENFQMAQRKIEKATGYPIDDVCQKLAEMKLINIQKKGRGNIIILLARNPETLSKLNDIATAEEQSGPTIAEEKSEKSSDSEAEGVEVETNPIEINNADLESLAHSLGITSKNTKKILASMLKHPGITAKEIFEETGIGINNVFTYSNQLLVKKTGLGLIIKRQKDLDNKLVKTFWPVKGVIEKMQKITAEKNGGKLQMPKPESVDQKPESKTPQKSSKETLSEQSEQKDKKTEGIIPEKDQMTIPVIINRNHTEEAKRLLKTKVDDGLGIVDLLKELNLPCNKETAEKLLYFIGRNFAFIEGNIETDFENCKIKIQENAANAIRRGNVLIEIIKGKGRQNGEEEWQINFGKLCREMNEQGYDDPEKIKKSIRFLRMDPDTTKECQILIIHADKKNKKDLSENDLIKLIRR